MLRLTRADVERFAGESGDQNPLHVSPEYARATAFGQPIAHGVLGLLSAARALPELAGKRLRKLAVEFPRPIQLELDYAVELREDGPDAWALEVRDGSKPAIRGVLELGDDEGGRVALASAADMRERAARQREFVRGHERRGGYGPVGYTGAGPWHADGRGLRPTDALALMLCSYIVGMELPGELALFTRLALEFDAIPPHGGELGWIVRVEGWQPRTGALRLAVELVVGDVPWVKGSLRAFVRADAGEHAAELPRSEQLDPQAFAGKTAVIVGASRGLGRSLARGFAAHGGRVFAVSRAQVEAEMTEQSGMIIPVRADARDPEQLASALASIDQVDLLVCNAAPPLQPLTLEPATAARVNEHIRDAVALVSTPLSLCLPALARGRGVALLCSSQAVAAPPVEWAHYVAGKRAGEALFEVAALQYPDARLLVARLPRLATGYSLNVSGEAAAATGDVALRLLEAVANPDARGSIEL